MLWHRRYRTTTENHINIWYPIKEEDLMKEYINRHKDEDVLELMTKLGNEITYSCSDHRLHPRAEASVSKYAQQAIDRHEKDFTELEDLISDCIKDNGCIPYYTVFHLLAVRYLGAGLVAPDR